MKSGGFSLIELLVVLALFGILMALAVMPFGQMNRRSTIERQITEMYQEIVIAQRQAMQTKRQYRVSFAPNTVTISFINSETDLTETPVVTKSLPVTIMTSPNAADIVFDTKGIMVDPIIKCICIQSNAVPSTESIAGPKVDSIVIAQSQISLGQIINQGAGCGTANILKK